MIMMVVALVMTMLTRDDDEDMVVMTNSLRKKKVGRGVGEWGVGVGGNKLTRGTFCLRGEAGA